MCASIPIDVSIRQTPSISCATSTWPPTSFNDSQILTGDLPTPPYPKDLEGIAAAAMSLTNDAGAYPATALIFTHLLRKLEAEGVKFCTVHDLVRSKIGGEVNMLNRKPD